jgi:hypothetical protein
VGNIEMNIRERIGWYGQCWSGPRKGPVMTVANKVMNESSDSIKFWILEWLDDWQLLKKGPSQCR